MLGSRRSPDLRKLNEAVERAKRERFRPSQPDEGVRAIRPVEMYLDEFAIRTVWRTISQLGQREPELYNLYVGERFLFSVIVDVVADHEDQVDWRTLVAQLESRARMEGEWLIGVPLANALTSPGYRELGTGVGIALTVPTRDWSRERERPPDDFAMYRHLKDRFSAGVRWRPHEEPDERIDTRRTAVLFHIQSGTQTAALTIAEARTQYAIAMWCLLRPPDHAELWPDLATWEPRPFMQHDIEHKLYQPDKWIGGETPRGRNITHRKEYQLPEDAELLAAPFRALELAPIRACARAVLSASWALYLAEPEPRDLQRTDDLLMLSTAIESLCDLGDGAGPGGDRRWGRITERYGIWRELGGLYSQHEIKEAKRLARDLRNIAAHGADDVLVNTGYPPELQRLLPGGREVSGADLSSPSGRGDPNHAQRCTSSTHPDGK